MITIKPGSMIRYDGHVWECIKGPYDVSVNLRGQDYVVKAWEFLKLSEQSNPRHMFVIYEWNIRKLRHQGRWKRVTKAEAAYIRLKR